MLGHDELRRDRGVAQRQLPPLTRPPQTEDRSLTMQLDEHPSKWPGLCEVDTAMCTFRRQDQCWKSIRRDGVRLQRRSCADSGGDCADWPSVVNDVVRELQAVARGEGSILV